MGLLSKVLRTGEGKMLRSLQSLVPDVNAHSDQYSRLSDEDLKAHTVRFRERLDRGESLDDLLIEAFATVREAAGRVIGQRHYDVQLMGGAALHFGWVAEMKTGEGKTLVSTLPVYLNGLSGRGLHVITVNDYLATRDAEWMGQIHNWLGLSVGLVVPSRSDAAYKREQYASDVTYGTNNEFGFDYLRDNMAMSRAEQVQRGHVYAIVDEIDSILIDEARTPLIISGRVADAAQLYQRFATVVRRLRRDEDYEVDEEKRQVAVLEPGIEKVEADLGVENLYDVVSTNLVHHLNQALKAKELFHRDKDYIVESGEVKIVDEFTGRTLEGRRWSEGLHQAVEAKEGVHIKEENQTLATITLQNYFRMYEKLSGMTGTAQTEASELANTYNLQVVPIPTNKPLVRDDRNDLIYRSVSSKFDAVVEDIQHRYEEGQPVLAGTASVEHSEVLSKLLVKRGIRHEVLNAKAHARESEIIAQAGRMGAVTVATNMAGRGVDILLGGNAELMALADLRAKGVEAATVDEVRRRVIELERRIDAASDADSDTPTDDIGALRAELEEAIENRDFFEEARERYEEQTRDEKKQVVALGGLYVVGTERHDSRRIDNQLRGRSGRQGDPGESRFYISLEDDLMRLFATGVMERVMSVAMPDDVPIEARSVTKAVERAQTTVEQRNAEIRKNVLKYDEVMNEQRKVVYGLRAQILDAENLRERSMEYLAEAVDGLIAGHCTASSPEDWNLESLLTDAEQFWPTQLTVAHLAEATSTDDLYGKLSGEATAFYEDRESRFGADTMRQLERGLLLQILDQHWREHLYEMDYLREGIGLRAMGQRDPLTEWQREGYDMFDEMMQSVAKDFVRYIMHVELTPSAAAAPAPGRVAARQDPAAATDTADTDTDAIDADTDAADDDIVEAEMIDDDEPADGGAPAVAVPKVSAPAVRNITYTSSDSTAGAELSRATRTVAALTGAGASAAAADAPAPEAASQAPVVKADSEKIGRNSPCHCGSGKKYKQCHGRSAAGAS